eukprot:TRINITY_DN40514_c0_g1_i1.p1 TRINITY_DN40514_c0_g1~~TRINITY_DN40514_c0_g1_i1.p1  ORF type:complete len:284 (+),score=37.07 TRINITY_DN40514_c0_g1_i1:226-1077(+)
MEPLMNISGPPVSFAGSTPCAIRRRNTQGLVNHTGRINIALGFPRNEELDVHGFFTSAGLPINMQTYTNTKQSLGARGYKGLGSAASAGNTAVFDSSFPLAPVSDSPRESKPLQKRMPERPLAFHPLGMTDSADAQRLMPGINSLIQTAAREIKEANATGVDNASLPRYRKAQNAAMVRDDMDKAMAAIKPHLLRQAAPWCGARPQTTSTGRSLQPGSIRSKSVKSGSQSSSCCRCGHVRNSLTPASPPSLVPELMELLDLRGPPTPSMRHHASSPALTSSTA